ALVTGIAGIRRVVRIVWIAEITGDKESFIRPRIHSSRKAVHPVAFSRIIGQQSKLVREMDSEIVGRLDFVMHLAAEIGRASCRERVSSREAGARVVQ